MSPEHNPCVQCGMCLAVCPLFKAANREEYTPRAKFQLARSLDMRREGLDEKQASRLAALCLSCGRCAQACPAQLKAGEVVARARAAHAGFQNWVWKTMLGNAGLLWPLGGGLADAMPGMTDATRRMRAQLSHLKDAPPFTPWATLVRLKPRPGTAVVFDGCMGSSVRQRWHHKAVSILRQAGATLLPRPGFECCGATLGHAGMADGQRKRQQANLKAWRAAGRPALVTYCASCRHGLAAYVNADLDWQEGEREAFLAALTPLSRYLEGAEFESTGSAPPAVHYHRPCHAMSGDEDEAPVRAMAGERFGSATREHCCGFGGVFQLAAPELGRTVATSLWNGIGATPGDQLLTGCSGCQIQLSLTAPDGVIVGHWLDALET